MVEPGLRLAAWQPPDCTKIPVMGQNLTDVKYYY